MGVCCEGVKGATADIRLFSLSPCRLRRGEIPAQCCQSIQKEYKGTTAQFGGASGDVFSAICGMQISRFTSSKPSEFAFASDEKSIRQPTTSFVRCYPNSHLTMSFAQHLFRPGFASFRSRVPPVRLTSLSFAGTKNLLCSMPCFRIELV